MIGHNVGSQAPISKSVLGKHGHVVEHNARRVRAGGDAGDYKACGWKWQQPKKDVKVALHVPDSAAGVSNPSAQTHLNPACRLLPVGWQTWTTASNMICHYV